MPSQNPVLLLTGRPGVGKSTIIQEVVAGLDRPAGGFYTREMRRKGRRIGFEIVTLSGKTAPLASSQAGVTFPDAVPFNRYQVNLRAMTRVAIPSLQAAVDHNQLVILDEIGPMELLSERFQAYLLRLLDGPASVLGTIARRRDPFLDRVRQHPRVSLLRVNPGNRDELPAQLIARLSEER